MSNSLQLQDIKNLMKFSKPFNFYDGNNHRIVKWVIDPDNILDNMILVYADNNINTICIWQDNISSPWTPSSLTNSVCISCSERSLEINYPDKSSDVLMYWILLI